MRSRRRLSLPDILRGEVEVPRKPAHDDEQGKAEAENLSRRDFHGKKERDACKNHQGTDEKSDMFGKELPHVERESLRIQRKKNPQLNERAGRNLDPPTRLQALRTCLVDG